jgi:DNA-binding XRE family transcriptional regulator
MKRASKLLIEKLESEVGPLTFGMFLRVSRNSMGLAQQEMANQLGIAKGTLCDIEKGRQAVSVELAKKIAKLAGLSEVMAIEACFTDQLKKAKSKLHVTVTPRLKTNEAS